MVKYDDKGVPQAAQASEVVGHVVLGPKPTRRRDNLLPALLERQRRSRLADSARNILAKHHHAVTDIGPGAAHDRATAFAKWHSDTDDRNIARILATQ